MVGLAAAQSPNAPSTWTQAPWSWAAAMAPAKSSKAPLLTLPACRHTIVGPRGPAVEDAGEVADVDRPLVVCGHRLQRPGAQTEECAGPGRWWRGVRRSRPLAAAGRSGEPVALDVPAGAREHVVTGRRQRHGVGALSAGHEAERCARRQAQKLLQPIAGDVLDDRCSRGRSGALKAFWSQPLVSMSAAMAASSGAADHEPEVARTVRRHQRRLDCRDQLLDHHLGCSGTVGQCPESGPYRTEVDSARVDGPLTGMVAVVSDPRTRHLTGDREERTSLIIGEGVAGRVKLEARAMPSISTSWPLYPRADTPSSVLGGRYG